MPIEERTTISLNPYTVEILNKAAAMWPEFATRSELMRKILADWDRLRNEPGGGRMARIVALEHDSSVLQERIVALEERMALVECRLGIGTYDTDHD